MNYLKIKIQNWLITCMAMLMIGLASCDNRRADYSVGTPVRDTTVRTTPGEGTYNFIFKKGSNGYSCYRIPAIIKAKDGSILAFAEARKNSCGDEGDIDLVMKRSTDNGKTWSAMQKIWDDGANTCGNPAPVIDQSSGKIFLLMTWNKGTDAIGTIGNGTSADTRRVFITTSSDNGLTWTTVKQITSEVKDPSWGWYATGPCHGIQVSKGAYAGRLVIPCDYIEVGSGKKGYSHVIYSDDKGETWKIGGTVVNGNESTIAELSDGRLMLNMRNSGSSRRVAISSNGGITWGPAANDLALPEPVCQGSLLSYPVNGVPTLFFANPSSLTRVNMTIKMSINDGVTWNKSYKVNGGPSAYSDLVMISDTEIGILSELGAASPYEGISFKSVLLSDFR